MTGNPHPPDREKPPLSAYFTLDALNFAILWGISVFLARLLVVLRWVAVRVQRARNRATGALTKYWYRNVTRFLENGYRTFLNYGYAGLDETDTDLRLSEADEPNRISIQLYHHVLSAIEVPGLDLLEVSCGHGGGASYAMRYLEPRSVVGVDVNPVAIDWCQRWIRVEGLSFAHADAQCLPFEANRFDAVINVEASHCYPDMKMFLSEVRRVLRPGGHFLFADVRMGKAAGEILDGELGASGLELIKKEDITANVVKALESDSERRLDLVRRLAPRFCHHYLQEWAAVKGSSVFESFRTGESVYLNYTLRKPTS